MGVESVPFGRDSLQEDACITARYVYDKDIVEGKQCFDIVDIIGQRLPPFSSWKPRPILYDNPRYLWMVIMTIWDVLLIGLWFGKYLLEDPGDYDYYLTNWSWSTQATYFFLKLVALYIGSQKLLFAVNFMIFWPTWMLVWGVFWMVTAVLYDSPELVTSAFSMYGAGLVMVVNTIYHYITVVMMFIDIFLSIKDHWSMLYVERRLVWLFILLNVALAELICIFYLIVNNPTSVYQLHHLKWWGLLIIYQVVILVAGVMFMYASSSLCTAGKGGVNFAGKQTSSKEE
jgi:hypothetical protein